MTARSPRTTVRSQTLSVYGPKEVGKRISITLAPRPMIRRAASDASIQKTRTSKREHPNMIPANHAKTPENWRFDFFEDPMSQSIISDFELYRWDWSNDIGRPLLEDVARAILDNHVKILAPSLYDDQVCRAIKDTIEQWGTGNLCSAHNDLQHRDSAEGIDERYWSAYRYLNRLLVLQSLAKKIGSSGQILFPASVAKYFARESPDSPRLAGLAFDPRKVVRDYAILVAGPWGR